MSIFSAFDTGRVVWHEFCIYAGIWVEVGISGIYYRVRGDGIRNDDIF